MNRLITFSLPIALLAAADAAVPESAGRAVVIETDLTPQQVVAGRPAAALSAAKARLQFDAARGGSIDFSGVQPTNVSIHSGHAGETGPEVAEFLPSVAGRWILRKPVAADPFPPVDFSVDAYYLRIESDAGALRGQLLHQPWDVQVLRLAALPLIPQLPAPAQAVVAVTLNPDTGDIRIRLTTRRIDSAVRAALRSSFYSQGEQTIVDLEQSAHSRDVWGSRDINDECSGERLSAAGLEAYRQGRLVVQLDVLDEPAMPLRARLAPPATETTTTLYSGGPD